MSTWGRAQDAFMWLWEDPYTNEPGEAQTLGISYEQWSAMCEPVLEAVSAFFAPVVLLEESQKRDFGVTQENGNNP